jgi:hypothetical protein
MIHAKDSIGSDQPGADVPEHPVQAELVVQPGRVHRQVLGLLVGGHDPPGERRHVAVDGLHPGPDGERGDDEDGQPRCGTGQPGTAQVGQPAAAPPQHGGGSSGHGHGSHQPERP